MSIGESIHLRPSQEEILAYQGGKMGISAVPGSGKTWTSLSWLPISSSRVTWNMIRKS